ncbi:serine hydrolase domain-containing protein [Flagellimonas algicola]|uniref:Serine hydrolase n=1 Tax=Flagellimonas algicola TaxID=2583815 RepID=A0ABY2WPS2_9FLAO|nr:serine hydrolase [Allomuricauda algicola]TMU56986.1 serine hydrolase [Allomuricauda algicola]
MKLSKFSVITTSLLFFLLLIACQNKAPQKESNITAGKDFKFETASPSKNGLDSILIKKMEDSIQSGSYPNIHSVLILKNQKLVYEAYFKGHDELWGDSLGIIQHHRDSLHDVRSISKSIVATCLGIALKRGKIDSISQSIFDFYPEYGNYKVGLRSQITIEHLLTMTTGMEWNENVPYTDSRNSEIQMTSSDDPIEFVLSRPLQNIPGEKWEYNGGTTQLLASIIERATGKNIHEYAEENLFAPLGITGSEWTKFPGLDIPAAASGLRLKSRDLMKFGMLYTNHGQWNGKQLLSKSWVNNALQPHIWFGRNNNVGYGYQFWIFKSETINPNHAHLIPSAVGNGGQRIYIDSKNNMIIVITAGNYNNWTLKKDSEALLVDFIYPALISN